MDIRQRIIKFAATLRKQFPERDGAYAIVMTQPPRPQIDESAAITDERYQIEPHEDNRPQFVKDDEVGWQRIGVLNDK